MTARLGVLTPSSNTALEPLTSAMAAALPGVTAHFSRFRVTEITLAPGASSQFDEAPVLAAAELLAHAKVDVIAWSGTAAAWRGFAGDAALCRAIQARTGIQATTSVLAMNAALATLGARRLGLVTPYTADVQARIVANYASLGFACAAERHLGLQDNFSFAAVPEETLAGCIRAVASAGVDAVLVLCTNLAAAPLVAALERELGVPVLDSVACAVWGALSVAGIDPAGLAHWGRLFQLGAAR